MQLYDTLTRGKQELPPTPGPIRMYFCGPTVYQRAHIGNARPFILGMWLRSWLRSRGYDVTLVHNITDINDKIYDAAPGESAELARQATEWYLEDTDALGLGRPDAMPKATEVVPQIVRFISELIDRGHAYESDGDVYFRVASYREYGQLSGQRPDQVASGGQIVPPHRMVARSWGDAGEPRQRSLPGVVVAGVVEPPVQDGGPVVGGAQFPAARGCS